VEHPFERRACHAGLPPLAALCSSRAPPCLGAVQALPDEDAGTDSDLDRELVSAALQQLSPAHRAVLIEAFYNGGSLVAVARELGIPHGTARSRTHYALQALREQLHENDAIAVLMRSRARPGVPAAATAPGTASPAASRPAALRLIAALLIAAAGLDLTRCSLVLMTFRHVAPAVGLVAAGIGAAVVSVTAARGYRAGQRWAPWAALLIGVASAPQASASGFHNPYTIPDVATASLGVLLATAILATVGRTATPAHPPRALAPPRSTVRPAESVELER